jgi:two-component system nitrogen regulation response regulator NtrX
MSQGTLLIVDDEPLILKWLRSNLEEDAGKVLTATNGLEAMAILEAEDVHCVICDINMPKLNGLDVIKRLRGFNKTLPFIFFTGHGSQDLMLEAAKYGAFDFLDKPNLDGLEEVVLRGLQQGLLKKEPVRDV